MFLRNSNFCRFNTFHRNFEIRPIHNVASIPEKVYWERFHSSIKSSSTYFATKKFLTRSFSAERRDSKGKKNEKRQVCLIVGAGAGIGEALTRRFTREGYVTGKVQLMRVFGLVYAIEIESCLIFRLKHVDKLLITVVARRDAHALKHQVKKLQRELMEEKDTLKEEVETDFMIIPHSCDARKEKHVIDLFEEVEENVGEISVCIFNVGANISFPILETTSQKFYKCWEMACYSGFLVGREAAKFMIPRQAGTIIFTGATASTRGAANFAAFSVAKSGLRALSQSMARELGPKGIHVSHVIIDAAVDTPWIRENFSKAIEKLPKDGLANPDDIADAYWHLASQQKSAWTHEMDLRPYCERF